MELDLQFQRHSDPEAAYLSPPPDPNEQLTQEEFVWVTVEKVLRTL